MLIGSRKIGPGEPVFIIAEAGVNHNGKLELALELVEAAARCGADAVKFQTFRAEELVTATSPKAGYQLETTAADQSQLAMLKELELDEAAHRTVLAACEKAGIVFLSTPFDHPSARLLASLGVPAFKLGSGELTDLPLLSLVASFGQPMLVSTGMSWLGEVEAAVKACQDCPLALLHCVSNYPADPGDANLRALDTLSAAFAVPVGFSDHTLGWDIAVAAVARGACVLEKHLTLDKAMPGPDHRASLDPADFLALVQSVRRVEAALGDGVKRPRVKEENTRTIARKSLVALRDIAAGEMFDETNVGVRRPGTGLPPGGWDAVLGRSAKQRIEAGTPLSHLLIH